LKQHKGTQTKGVKNRLYPEHMVIEIKQGLHKELVICEGEFKALLLLQMGIPALSPTAGAGNWDDAFTEVLMGVDRVIIAYDYDQAGKDGTRGIATSFKDKDKSIYSIDWSTVEGMVFAGGKNGR
ncbi:MAG: toprim domain-containing protein, partial [Nitrospirae bacterium]|nr:toprim domain-containing protein [Nitrospirota bacterium]